MIGVSWVKCGNGNNWCPFESVDLDGVDAKGIYVIWYNGNPGRVVRVGQGDVKDRLTKHRVDKQILAYKDKGLLVTWASVSSSQRDGIERYLADQYSPLVGDAYPDVLPIAVNSPWS
jgi:hypothetical protein